MGAVTNTRNAERNLQITHGINMFILRSILSISVQHTVAFELLRLSSKGQSLQRTWYVLMRHGCCSTGV